MNVHRILNRLAWCTRSGHPILLWPWLLRSPTAPCSPGARRHDQAPLCKRIAALWIYLDPIRSSDGHLVNASGLR